MYKTVLPFFHRLFERLHRSSPSEGRGTRKQSKQKSAQSRGPGGEAGRGGRILTLIHHPLSPPLPPSPASCPCPTRDEANEPGTAARSELMIWGRSPRTLPDSALGLGAVPAAAQRSEARNGVDAEGPRGSRGYPEQGSDVAECRTREIGGVGGRLEITRPRCVMKQLNAGLRTRLHPDPCFGGEKPPRSWVGAGCRQEPRSKAGSERGGLISNSSTSETKPNPKKKNSAPA